MLNIIQITASGLLLLLGTFFITMNWVGIARWFFTNKHYSWVPLLGGVLASIGMATMPNPTMNSLWWTPLFIDWGCVPGFSWTISFFAWRALTNKN